jgi:LysR family carnitine catabolism transcriptional activator
VGQEQRYKEIQLPQLRSFCLAATERNFTTAARALGLTAPTVWQQVRALERRLQSTLLRRRGRNVELTPEGQLLLELIHPHVSGLDSLEALFAARKSRLACPLTVAAIPYLTSSHLLAPIREYSAAHPHVQLKLHVCVWFDDVLRMVERGNADLGIMFYDRDGPRNLRLAYERLFDLRFVLLVPEGHPLTKKKHIPPTALTEYPLIVPPEGSYARRKFEQLLARYELSGRVQVVMETPLLDIIRKYVAAGVGIAPVHIGQEPEPTPGVHIGRFADDEDRISAGMVTRKGAHLSDPVRAFTQIIRNHLAEPRRQLASE